MLTESHSSVRRSMMMQMMHVMHVMYVNGAPQFMVFDTLEGEREERMAVLTDTDQHSFID